MNTGIPTAAKTASDTILLYAVGSKAVEQLSYILDEYVHPLMEWVVDMLRGIPSSIEKTFTKMLCTVKEWYERIRSFKSDGTWKDTQDALAEFLASVGIGYGTGRAIDWSAVWTTVKGSVTLLARRIADIAYRTCGLLLALLADTTIAAAGYMYKWGRTELTVVILQYGYLAYLVRQHYQTAVYE